MTPNSLISNIMYNNTDTWTNYFATNYPDIKIKYLGPYAIFNYDICSNFNDPVIQEARGIIIDIRTFDVVCWPFRKFGKYNDRYADKIDWESAKVQEKIDGSIIKLWYSDIFGKWMWSTNSTIDSKLAFINQERTKTFFDIILQTDEFYKIASVLEILDHSCTYIFELVSLQTQVVVPYNKSRLYLIGLRNNITGIEYDDDITLKNIPKPRQYDFKNTLECKEYLSKIKTNSFEGFVVVDKDFNRVKIKSDMYMMLHGLSTNDNISTKSLIDLLLFDKINIIEVCKTIVKLAPIIKHYDKVLHEYFSEADANIERMYIVADSIGINTKDSKHDRDRRKKLSEIINGVDKKYHNVLYKSIDTGLRISKDIIKKFNNPSKFLLSVIPKYEK